MYEVIQKLTREVDFREQEMDQINLDWLWIQESTEVVGRENDNLPTGLWH